MGILFIAEAIIASDPAYRRRVLHLMREARGVAPVSLFVYGVAPAPDRAELLAALVAAGIPRPRSIRLPAVRGLRTLSFFATLLAAWLYLFLRLRFRRDVRIVQAENLLAFLPLIPFARGRRGPAIVLDAHGVVPEEVRLKRPGSARVVFPLLKRLERAALDGTDALVVPSECFRRHAVDTLGYPPGSLVVVPNRGTGEISGPDGMASARAALGLADRPVIVYAGGAAAYQEPERMIDAFAGLLREEPRACFLCLTTDPGRFEALFRSANLPAESRRVMRVAPADVARHLQAGDVALLIRNDSLVNRVSSPTKFTEYLAAGVPVVTTPGAGDAAEIVEEEDLGRVVPDLSASAIARAVLELMRFPKAERGALRARCRTVAGRMVAVREGEGALARLYADLRGRGGDDG